MAGSYFLAFFLGVAAVLQGGLNRTISNTLGMASTLMVNNIVLLIAGFALFYVAKAHPETVPPIFRMKQGGFQQFSWWLLIPGLLGFSLVSGIPYAISKIGASKLFVILIGAQLVASLAWDAIMEGKSIDLPRVAGVILAFAGAYLVVRAE